VGLSVSCGPGVRGRDRRTFLGSHLGECVPPVSRVVQNGERLSLLGVLVDQARLHQIGLLESPGVCECERLISDGPSEGSPDVDELARRCQYINFVCGRV
jgi:hypothetical protein